MSEGHVESTIADRVAQAIYESGEHPKELDHWSDLGEEIREYWRVYARAALATITQEQSDGPVETTPSAMPEEVAYLRDRLMRSEREAERLKRENDQLHEAITELRPASTKRDGSDLRDRLIDLPEREWNPGDSGPLPPVPDEAYPADAEPLMSEPYYTDDGNVTVRLSFRVWLWCLWHTRPGHRPAGIIYSRSSAFCTACGAEVPQ